ncbi:MAG: hypothetical protein HDR02_17240 [Lachnospiraceae bacterium]|nr:hypothetical protein [Lachnospiraceae bacterium]
MVGLGVIFTILLLSREEKKTIIEVEGFEIEYKATDRRITMEDNKVVVFHFKYPAAFEDLVRIVLVNKNGKSQIIKAVDNTQ